MREIAGALVLKLPERYCPGERGLCFAAVKWCVLRRTKVGFSTRWWCDKCLPAKYRR